MKYIKRFEDNDNEDPYKLFYKKLESFFRTIINDKKYHVVNTYKKNVNYGSYVGIFINNYDYTIKISNGLILQFELDHNFPSLDLYLNSKLPFNKRSDSKFSKIHNNKIDINEVMKNIDNINFSKEEYELFKNINKYNL